MRDSLDDLENDLGRLPDLRQNDARSEPSPAQQIRRALRGKHVCPFCGTQRETDLGPCMHCSLEDTPTTRSATRAKLGPWYVLQSRNPSAPGMNFATLMTLVQKGRVTARSVVRGPTTGQFWRHAAKIKGVSREFGLCWNCGGDVSRTARACAGCKRLQEPPLNPDVLLEAGELSGEELAEAMWADQPTTSSQMSASSQMPSTSARGGGGSGNGNGNGNGNGSPVDRLVSRGGVRREVPPGQANGDVAGIGNLPPRSTRGVLADAADQLPPMSLEMAMFQTPKSYDGINEQRRGVGMTGAGGGAHHVGRRGASRRVLKTLGVSFLLMSAGVVLICTFDPNGAGRKLRTLVEKAVARVGAMVDGNSATRPAIFTVPPASDRASDPEARRDGAAGEPVLSRATEGAPAGGSPTEATLLKMDELYRAGKAAEQRGDFESALRSWEGIKSLGIRESLYPIDLDAQIASAKKKLK
jgi:hypothetical protein